MDSSVSQTQTLPGVPPELGVVAAVARVPAVSRSGGSSDSVLVRSRVGGSRTAIDDVGDGARGGVDAVGVARDGHRAVEPDGSCVSRHAMPFDSRETGAEAS
jgi:hypothetical protein